MNNPDERLRCASCGEVDIPRRDGGGHGRIALALWALVGLLWAIDFAVTSSWLIYVAAIAFLIAFVYTLRYFFRREQACRHCGATRLEPAS